DDAVLDDLGEAAPELAVGERIERGEVDPDADRLMEDPDHVLAARMVDRDLAADGAVDHGEQGGRDHEEGQSAGVGSGDEASKIADDPAAHRDNESAAVGREIDERVVEAGGDCKRFLSFAGRTGDDGSVEALLFE